MLGLLTWWYTTGWQMLVRRAGGRIFAVLNTFSVAELAGSIFAPFRQISAGQVQGSLSVKFRAWLDRQFSRIIGAIVRLTLIFCGLLLSMIVGILALLLIIAWPLVPISPIVGIWLSGSVQW